MWYFVWILGVMVASGFAVFWGARLEQDDRREP